MRRPVFVTFTGADDHTDVDAMVELAREFPIEWGVLFSPTRQGVDPRYPADPMRFAGRGLTLAAHLCGDHSRAISDGRPLGVNLAFLAACGRIQVNHPSPNIASLIAFHREVRRQCIAQVRTGFPLEAEVQWLFDASGGRGLAPPRGWPPHPGYLVGYAGGIGPENVREVLAAIDAPGPYWVDMESGVRTDDRFDLELCRRVCEAVYGR